MNNILLVDDSHITHLKLEEYIQNKYQLISAYDTKQARSKIGNNQIDLIILDINLPGLSGIDFCKELRAGDQKDVPIIFLTSKKENIIEALQSGGNDFLGKPFHAAELIVRIENLLKLFAYHKQATQLKKIESMQIMVATLKHELNNPLTIAMANLQTIKKGLADEKQITSIDKVYESLARMAETLEKLKKITDKDYDPTENEMQYSADSKIIKLG